MNILYRLLKFIRSPWGLLVTALLVATGLTWITYQYLREREVRIKEEVIAEASHDKERTPTVSVVVPISDAGLGSVVSSDNFAARAIAEDLVYPDVILANNFEQFTGLKLAKPVQRGRPLRVSDLMATEVKDVAEVVPNGMRAVTVPIDNLNSIAQTLRPGNQVDIFLLSRAPKQADDVPDEGLDQASLFMQNMEVLAVGRDFTDPRMDPDISDRMTRAGDVPGTEGPSYDTATLLVTPAQAAKLLIGQKMGSYRLALRGRQDTDAVNLPPLSAAHFLPAPPPRPVQSQAVQYIVGGAGAGGEIVSTRSMPPETVATTMLTPSINPQNNEDLEQAIAAMKKIGALNKAGTRSQNLSKGGQQ